MSSSKSVEDVTSYFPSFSDASDASDESDRPSLPESPLPWYIRSGKESSQPVHQISIIAKVGDRYRGLAVLADVHQSIEAGHRVRSKFH